MNAFPEIDKQSIIPIYYQVAKILKQQILNGELKPGEALPPEMDIAARFGISRMTVRRAIAELASAGMVYSQKGRGTFVARPKLSDVMLELNDGVADGAAKDAQKGVEVKTTLLEARIIRINDELKRKLQVDDANARFLFFRTLVSAQGERLAYEKKYIRYFKRQPILETELKDPTLSNLVATHCDVLPVSAKKVVQVSLATEEEASILRISKGAPVFEVEQTIYDLEENPIGWGRSIYRGDRYRLTTYEGWRKKE